MVISMFKELRRIDELSENFNEEMKTICFAHYMIEK